MGKSSRTKRRHRGSGASVSDDEIDAFNDSKVAFVDEDGANQDSDLDEDDDKREVVLDDLSDSSESEAADESDGDDVLRQGYEEEKELAKVGKAWGRKAKDYFKSGEISDEESDDSEDDDDDDDGSEAVGKAQKEEEEEALRIKRKQLQNLRDEDFDLIENNRETKKKQGKETESITVRMKKRNGGGIEKLAKESPEVLGLVADVNRQVEVLRKQISPLLEAFAGRKESLTSQGNSYIEAKFHILLSYCINTTFYLLMKAKGESVKDHPVVEELVRLRTTMEKLRPLDNKLKTQFQTLIQQATAPSKELHRPNVEDLVDEEDAEEEELEAEGDEDGGKELAAKKDRNQKYTIPKLAAVPFEEESGKHAREKRKEKQRKERARKSQFLTDVREEFSERPMEQSAIGTEAKHSSARDEDEERRRFEESNFMRLRETKKERSARRKRERMAEEGMAQNLAEFEAFEGFDEGGSDGESSRFAEHAERAEALRKFMKKVEASSRNREEKTKKSKRSGDEITKQKDPMLLEMKMRRNMSSDDDAMPEPRQIEAKVDSGDEDEFYQQVKKLRRKRKRERTERFHVERPAMHEPSRLVDDGELRGATYKILKNRGLTPHKKKEDKNPRVKMRKKYEKKMKARKGQVREMRQAEDVNYLGEASGLRSNLVRSRKIGKTK